MRGRKIDRRNFSARKASKRCHSCRKAAQRGRGKLEIFDFPGSNKDLEKESDKVWPDVTYKGQDIVGFIVRYSDKIEDQFMDPQFGYNFMQECYGGYDIKTDTYYMGFDTSSIEELIDEVWDDYEQMYIDEEYEEEIQGWSLFSIKNGKIKEVASGSGKMFYFDGYKVAKRLGIADLRLD